MTAVIVCRGLAGTLVDNAPPPPAGAYLAAFDYWRQPSATMPVRADGNPNCPLTAYTVEVGEMP